MHPSSSPKNLTLRTKSSTPEASGRPSSAFAHLPRPQEEPPLAKSTCWGKDSEMLWPSPGPAYRPQGLTCKQQKVFRGGRGLWPCTHVQPGDALCLHSLLVLRGQDRARHVQGVLSCCGQKSPTPRARALKKTVP